MVAIAIVGLVIAVTVPGSMRFYESIQYRQSVRDVLSALGGARQQAMDTGRAQDVLFRPREGSIEYAGETLLLPDDFTLAVTTASEVNQGAAGVIRFYPEGGSTGGDIDITAPGGRGVRIAVDWLMGGVTQVRHEQP